MGLNMYIYIEKNYIYIMQDWKSFIDARLYWILMMFGDDLDGADWRCYDAPKRQLRTEFVTQ